MSTVEHRRTHADQAFIFNRARMDDRRVPDRAPRADVRPVRIREMHHRVVLDVSPLAHADFFDITAQHRTIKNAARRPEHYVSYDRGVGRDKKGVRRVGLLPEVPRKPRGDTFVGVHFSLE
jgi:hypothetical protein